MNSIYRILLTSFIILLQPLCCLTFAQSNDDILIQHHGRIVKYLMQSQLYEEAAQNCEQIIEVLRKKDGSPKEIAVWLKVLGTCKLYTGKIGEAESSLLEALDIMNSLSDQDFPIMGPLLDALSVLYVQAQNYEKALYYSDQAKILFEKKLDFGENYVRCLSNLALVKAELGDNIFARMFIDVALRQAKANISNSDYINDTSYITSRIQPYITLLSNSSMIYQKMGYLSDAVKSIKESIRISEEYGLNEALPYNNLGTLYLYKSKFPQSVEWFLKSYQLSKTPYESDEIGMNTALGLFLSRDSRASAFCSEVSEKMRKNIQDMFAFMSSEERSKYWDHFENYLPVLNLIIYESGNTDVFGTIYDNILEAKGLLLRSTNAIRDAVLNSGNDNDIADFISIGQLKQKLLNEKDDETQESIEKEIEAIDKRLTQHVNAYADFNSSKTIHWEEVRDALSKDDAAIEFYNIPVVWGLDSIHTLNSEPRYCAVILKKGYEYPHIIPLCGESQLEDLDKEDLYETDSIYNLIWKPLELELKGIKNVYFAADRELHKIGIEYVPMPEGGIIGDKYNLYRVSSTRVLAENKKDSKHDNAVLYGGLNYDMGKEDLIAESRSGDYHTVSPSRAFTDDNLRYGVKYLPGTLKEVEDIAKGFVKEPRVITDATGTEESFKSLAGTPIDIIHLATHGFFWSDEDAKKRDYVTFLNPNNKASQSSEDKALMRSGLFFSGANVGLKGESLPEDVEDGVLTALELSNMNLGNVDMVVMSACESGLGETSGEGVFGLQRGFKLAGANTLLMSLWKVDDTATQILMTEFYKNYLSGKTKQESLRLAQKSLRDNPEYSDPQYWGAFILLDGLN